jgi:photosystem II PsbU protein
MKALVRFSIIAMAIAIFWTGFPGSFLSVYANELPETNVIKVDSSKIDVNNSNINAFRKIPGFYPTLGRIIIQNAPYSSLDDVLNISGLSDVQKQRIKDNAGIFIVQKPDNSLNRERYNNSIYRL